MKCGLDAPSEALRCERCGGKLRGKSMMRVLGVMMFLLGSLLIVVMSVLIVFTIRAANGNGNAFAGSRFTGTHSDLVTIYGVFGLVLVFGAVSAMAGLWQMIFGKRNKWLIWTVLGLGLLFYLAAMAVAFFL